MLGDNDLIIFLGGTIYFCVMLMAFVASIVIPAEDKRKTDQ